MAGERKRSVQAELFGDGAGIAAGAGTKSPATPLADLNAQQRAAVEHGDGPLLVVAGAGTGKTRVITERIRHLLESDPELPGEAIAGLTFTDKAAAEMKYRVTRSVGERGEGVFLGTFHAFCTKLLTEYDPDLKPIEEVDYWILLRRNLPLLQLERYRKLAEPGHFLSDFVKFFSRCQDELVTPERYDRYVAELEEKLRRDRAGHGGQASLAEDELSIRLEEIARQREIARAYRASDALLRGEKRLTFGMQLLDAVRTLDEDAALLARMRERFRYILVDEFQDTNVAQLELLWRLAGDHRNIVAVGDDAQAIYRFRGASFGSFTIFLEKFAGVAKGDSAAATRFVRPLVDNYRSTARVLRVAGQVTNYLEHSPLVPKKELIAHKNLGEKVRIVTLGSATEEARWIAAEIARLHAAGLRWRSFAALYRIHAHRDALVMALGERGIPFVIRNLSIMNHRLVLDLLAYLRLIARPSDDLACTRVLAAPAWGLQAEDLVRLVERAAKARKSLWETLQAGRPGGQAQGELLPPSGSAEMLAGVEQLSAGINALRERSKKLTAMELFDALAEWLEISVAVEAEDRRYVDRLGKFVREWQMKSITARLSELMQYLEYFVQAGGKIELEQDADDAVQLMTVHAAKGLEFDHVFVLRLTKNGFPMSQRTAVLEFPAELMQEELPAWDYHTQEERRLFYVALTRARERLTLTTVAHARSKASPLLDDILGEPKLTREHVEQSAPKAVGAPAESVARVAEPLFADAAKRPRVYSGIADWALEYRPPVFEPLQLSLSAIETYRTCPQKHLFSHVWGIRGGPHAAMTFGNVMHTTIREFLGALRKGRPLPPFEEVETIFRREWSSAGFEDRYQEECYQKDGLEQLRTFHAACMEAPPEIWAQEKAFALELENNVQVTGRIDQINSRGSLPGPDSTGSLPGSGSALGRADTKPVEVEIVDYKTGKPKTEDKARKDLQLGIYALAAREALDLNATLMVYHSLQNNERVTAGREAKQLADVRSTIQEVAGNIRAREFSPEPGFYCRSCDYRSVCPAQEAGRVLPEDDEATSASRAASKSTAAKKPSVSTTRV